MATLLWMLQQVCVPLAMGCIMAVALSRWSPLSQVAKIRTAFGCEIVIVMGLLAEPLELHAWLSNFAVQLRGGVLAAFGLTIAMSLLRLGETRKSRAAGGLFALVNAAALWLGFETEIRRAIGRIAGI